ncbi:Transcriptional regulator, MarR/EmrR family protein [Listeria weihenstephanensis FSL R9-0317]|uniref:MarR family transcriptional regulator n=1 Tax=Listeria weihenstephanensis TaxID=1006155 RepID=A0A1S7FRK4_9LIST|nr:MarR family transcriptional regulator [Listeria weihenstephanensis]AQY50007.1 MarR family transcriptional regulator [Listeria weihenstephanensis]EUJ34973.1 Transcriptional regulator, MarR/EmrR family protein [Listeria weihenstephanensis FSL R9-0317]
MKQQPLNTPFSDLFRGVGMKIKMNADTRLRELDLNGQQGRMIGYIYENQERGVIQKDLAEQFNRKGASITSMLQGLEKKGYIKRVIPENNERQKNIYVLDKGVALIEEFNTIFAEIEASITKDLTNTEAEQLKSLLTKVSNSL